MSVTIRIGFIGVDGSAIALAAEPTTSASAVIFSAVEQLRKFFDAHPNRSSPAWNSLFREVADANVRDAEDNYQYQQQQTQNQNQLQQQQNNNNDKRSTRNHAKRVLSRKIALLSTRGEKYIPGHEIISKNVQDAFLVNNMDNNNNGTRSNSLSSTTNNFFWMDLTDPPCRIQISFIPPRKFSQHYNSNSSSSSLSSHFETLDQIPTIATWTIENVIQRVCEKTGSVHPHNLECYLMNDEDDENEGQQQPLPRTRNLVDLFRHFRIIHLDVRLARPPSCTVRVVDADIAEKATRVLYANMGYSNAPNDSQDSFIQQQQEQHNNSNNNESYASFTQDELSNPYASDPSQLLNNHCRRTISLSNINWSTTLAEIHREAARLIHPLKGRGFLCLEQGLILRSSQAAKGDHRNAQLKLASTGNLNGSQVPVFSPAMTVRQVARVTVGAPNARSGISSFDRASASMMKGEVRLYIVVNPKDKDPPKVVSSRKVFTNDILHEADDARFQLLDVLYPSAREARLLQQQQQQSNYNRSLKRQNVIPGSPEDSSFHLIQQKRNNAADLSRKSVRFVDDSHHDQQQQFSVSSPVPQPAQHSPPRPFTMHNNDDDTFFSPPPDFLNLEDNNDHVKPTSPIHQEGVEAFIAMPSSTSSSGNEVVRLLLPDGYFPVRRLKRFLKMQAADSGLFISEEFNIQFGTRVLNDDDQDVKNYVNPDTNVVFLNAF